jgi:archaemetzincin
MMVLGLSAMDDVDDEILAQMGTALEECYPVRVTRRPRIALAGSEYDEKRKQHNAPMVLKKILEADSRGVEKLVGVTVRDLFIPMLSFVYGQAQLGGRAAVVSVARLRQEFYGLPGNRELLLARARKEAVHETGHLFGLVHCGERTCAMSLSTNVRQIDWKNDGLCAACRALVWEGHI